MRIVAEMNADESAREIIARRLIAFNLAQMPRLDGASHAFFLEDDKGDRVGGAWTYRRLDWLFLDLLFVPESARGLGMGSALLARVEGLAEALDARGTWLTTYGFQARGSYEKHGFSVFGTLPGTSADADQYLMRKPRLPI